MNLAEKALEELRTRGWTKNVIMSRDGRVCGMGAICAAQGKLTSWEQDDGLNWYIDDDYDAEEEREQFAINLRKIINEQYYDRGPFLSVPDFNDDERTDFADIERVFEKAAVTLDESV